MEEWVTHPAQYIVQGCDQCIFFWDECTPPGNRAPIYYTLLISHNTFGKTYTLLPPECYTRSNAITVNTHQLLPYECKRWFRKFLGGDRSYPVYVVAFYSHASYMKRTINFCKA